MHFLCAFVFFFFGLFYFFTHLFALFSASDLAFALVPALESQPHFLNVPLCSGIVTPEELKLFFNCQYDPQVPIALRVCHVLHGGLVFMHCYGPAQGHAIVEYGLCCWQWSDG